LLRCDGLRAGRGPDRVTRVALAVARQLPLDLGERTMSAPQRTGVVCQKGTPEDQALVTIVASCK